MSNVDKQLNQQVTEWIDIAKDDLATSKILYYANRHRNSYYFFQQSVEKANKALALYIGFTVEELKKEVGHNQLKIFRKQITNQEASVKQLTETLEKFPSLNDQALFKQFDFKEYHRSLTDSLSFFSQLNTVDHLNLPLDVIDELLNEIDKNQPDDFEFPDHTDPAYKQRLVEVADLLGKIDIKNGETTKAEFEAMINDPRSMIVLNKYIKYQQRWMKSMTIVEFTFIIMAFLTTNHNQTTRYIDGSNNPLKIYNKKLPLVRRQEELMQYFEFALNELIRIIQLKPLQL